MKAPPHLAGSPVNPLCHSVTVGRCHTHRHYQSLFSIVAGDRVESREWTGVTQDNHYVAKVTWKEHFLMWWLYENEGCEPDTERKRKRRERKGIDERLLGCYRRRLEGGTRRRRILRMRWEEGGRGEEAPPVLGEWEPDPELEPACGARPDWESVGAPERGEDGARAFISSSLRGAWGTPSCWYTSRWSLR